MRVSGPAITVGSGASDRLVVATKESFGDLYGKKLRSYFAGNPGAKSVTVVSNVDVIPRNNSFNILAVSGSETPENLNKLRDRFKCIRKLIVFAPTYAPEAISSVWAEDVEKIAVYGEFSQSFYVDLWQQRKLAYRVEAMGDFIPDWPALIERLNNVGSFQ
jgi:hypothetical protein